MAHISILKIDTGIFIYFNVPDLFISDWNVLSNRLQMSVWYTSYTIWNCLQIYKMYNNNKTVSLLWAVKYQ